MRENRRLGDNKAARTRRKKKLLPTVTEQQVTEEQNVEDIYGHICACCGEEEPSYAGKAEESVSWIEYDTCGMWLNALKLTMFQMETGFAQIAAKSWMTWLDTENV